MEDLSKEPEAIDMVDYSNTTCFGFEDRMDKTLARTISVELTAFKQDQLSIQVSFDRSFSCSELLNNHSDDIRHV